MVDEVKIETSGAVFDARTKIFIGRKNMTKQIKKCILILDKDAPTEILLVMEPAHKLKVRTKAYKKKSLIDEAILKVVKTIEGVKK